MLLSDWLSVFFTQTYVARLKSLKARYARLATRGVATGGGGPDPPTFVLDKFFNSFKTG